MRLLKYILLTAAAGTGAVYGMDALVLHLRAAQFADVKVDNMYAVRNRWGTVEYSVGASAVQRCVHAAFPHSGYPPCWYLNSRVLKFTHVG